jgi:hypothetical protein
MNDETPPKHPFRYTLLRWIDLAGLGTAAASLFAFVLLFALDNLAPTGNPYVGILAYLVAPAFLVLGLLLVAFTWIVRRRQLVRGTLTERRPLLKFDLADRRDRRTLVVSLVVAAGLLLLTAVGSYRSYHFTESTQFCGKSCHTVMEPEMATYENSPHARVACVECHIGPGATWYVKSKLSGLYQVYATLADKYPRPIPTPIHNLRPAQDTCEQCHWPKKFAGNLDRIYHHYLSDATNTAYSVRLSLKVGGGDPTRGPVGGIHWHMNVGNQVEYITTDEKHQVIPWVRITDDQGVVTEYRTEAFKDGPNAHVLHPVDCMSCHNRPSHIFQNPSEAVDLSLSLGRLDPTLPSIKERAVAVLNETYATKEEGLSKIATQLHAHYAADPRGRATIEEVQRIFRNNYFPEMKADWSVYPNNIGHKEWPGCFRCHDGQHKTTDGKQSIRFSDCNGCHVILAQGSPSELEQLSSGGQEFRHPGEEYDPAFKCSDCHAASK